MTKKETLKWRLSKLPSSDEVISLVKDQIITKEEAKEILFSKESEEDRDKKSLESEIKFLRELIAKLSENRNQIIEKIKYVEKPYYNYDWYKPYVYYCNTGGGVNAVNHLSTSGTTATLGSNSLLVSDTTDDFAAIKTF